MRQHFPSTGRGACLADAFASWRATANAAERKRSRSEADTGRKIGLGFGLCLFFGRENRSRFSLRAGPSMGLGFGQCFGLSFCGS